MNVETTGSGDVTPDSFGKEQCLKNVYSKTTLLVSVYSDRNQLEQTTDTKLWVVIS